MTGKKPAMRGKGKGKAATTNRNVVPDVYQEMLAEALPMQSNIPERLLKRRRIGRRDAPVADSSSANLVESASDGDDDIQFEDVLGLGILGGGDFDGPDSPPKPQQTTYRDSDEDSGESNFDWEGIDFEAKPQDGKPNGDLELTLTKPTPQRRTTSSKRRVVTKAERGLRLQIHKMHVLCLLSHVDRRNHWCNDPEVQSSLKPLVDKKALTFLRPQSNLSQFGRAESLKRGLDQVGAMWRKIFSITARGIRKALWAEEEQDLQNVGLISRMFY
jgi:xeroderma pigmentosum group C-complementing protein